MKKIMIMGGLMGFGMGVVTGLEKAVTRPALFLRAGLASLLSGLLFRWWGRAWISGLKESLAPAAAKTRNAGPNAPAK